MDVSPKGDAPGFVAVDDERTLLIPDRKGNKLVFGLQNILATGQIGVIFVVPGTTETLRVNGRAELTSDPAVCERLAARGQNALLAIRVTVEECFFHCGKALIRASLWKPETWPKDLRVSFGKMLAPKFGGDEALAEQIDRAIEDDYRENL
jgi:PPOX class probable FMN-dependent enzyme